MKIEQMPNYRMTTESDATNIFETSLVENPAIGLDFLMFSDEGSFKELEFAKIDTPEYQRMISGAWFVPDTKYLRYNQNTKSFYTVEFTRQDLKDALIKYLKADYANLIKVEHQGNYVDGFISIEHWIYDETNKQSPIFGITLSDMGYNEADVKFGTVFKSVYVESEAFWNEEILTGKVKGFSIGGLFSLESYDQSTSVEAFNEVEQPVIADVAVNDAVQVKPVGETSSLSAQQEVVGDVASQPSESVETNAEVETNNMVETNDVELHVTTPEEEEIANVAPQNNVVDTNVEIQKLKDEFESYKSVIETLMKENSLLKTKQEESEKERASLHNSLKEKESEAESLKTQLGNSPIKNTINSQVSAKDSKSDSNKGKKLIGGYYI